MTDKPQVITQNPTVFDKLFYWTYPEGRILAKSKLAAITVFVFLMFFWALGGAPLVFIPLSIIFAMIFYIIGYALHQVRGKPKVNKIKYNDYGFITDLGHLLFYWQNRNGAFVLSKTKILSFLVFLSMFVMGLFSFKTAIFFSAVFFGLLFEIPVFVLGTVIHKLSNRVLPENELPETPVRKVEKTPEINTHDDTGVIPAYEDYKNQLKDLKFQFYKKEVSARDLITKRFEPPQLTYTRFITGVDKSKELFNKNHESAMTMIELAEEYSPRIASEVESKIDILKAIIEKMDNLTNELIINEDLSKKEDVDNLIDQMDDLIDSVKDYND